MTGEEAENGRDDMLIDGCEAEPPQENTVPDGFMQTTSKFTTVILYTIFKKMSKNFIWSTPMGKYM